MKYSEDFSDIHHQYEEALADQIILLVEEDWDLVENDTELKNLYYEARHKRNRGGFTGLSGVIVS